MVRLLPMLLATAMLPRSVAAQDSVLAAGIAAANAQQFAVARHAFAQVLARDSMSYQANWWMGAVLTDLGKQIPDTIASAERDTLYRHAERYARRAIAAEPDSADGHFILAVAAGRAALSMGIRDRVRQATLVRSEAMRALAIDPRHDGAWHVLGRWNAEVMRLSGIKRFIAKAFLGGSVFKQASWQGAEDALARAVHYAPTSIIHRMDLAQVMIDRHEWAPALAQLDTIATLPPVDVLDPGFRRQVPAWRRQVLAHLDR